MDSPEPAKITTAPAPAPAFAVDKATTASTSSPPVQESPFSNFVSKLSPINSVKAAPVAQGFIGLNSPPIVFTSPHTVPHCETSFLQGSQLYQVCHAEIHKNHDGSKKFDSGPDDLEKSTAYLNRNLVIDSHKDNDVKDLVQDQPDSASGCADEYLSDPVEADCANSVNTVDPNVKGSSHVLQLSVSGSTNSEKVILNHEDESNIMMRGDISQALSEKYEEGCEEQSTSEINPVGIEEKQRSGGHPSYKYPNLELDLLLDHDAEKQQHDKGAQAHENCKNSIPVILGPEQNTIQHDSEASQLQRGVSRRCLQFEETHRKSPVNSCQSPNPTHNSTASTSPACITELDILDSSNVNLTASSSKRQLLSMSQHAATLLSSQSPHCIGKSPLTVSKPSGIGLHLNSIVNALPMACNATTSMKSGSIMSCHLVENKSNHSKLSNLVEKVSTTSEDRIVENKISIAGSSNAPECFHTEALDMLQPLENQVVQHDKRKFTSEHDDNFEELNQLSPKKKRKKLSNIDGDGSKRCNCKKSKCLKLYCDCFAAGIYCAESCACQGCFNRQEYKDTVLETRQQIESRNPLAFAPKVVNNVSEFPAFNGEDRDRSTPSSARHKRGCNCKKSMCLKKYCECYQANVGCSIGCRCDGCKNVYGRKEEYVMNLEMLSNRAIGELESTVDNKLEMVATNKDFSCAEFCDLHNLTPTTPSLQCSNHRKDATNSRLVSGRYVPSPECDYSMLPPYAKCITSPKSSHGKDMLSERRKDALDKGSCSQGMDHSISEMVDQFSPRDNEIADVCDLIPLPNPSTMASSVSSKTRDWTYISRHQLHPGSGHPSSGSTLFWRSSPISPLIRLDESKTHGPDSDGTLNGILEDDTPEILKEASEPTPSVKVSSPNKKRVSPPHRHIHELGSSSSGGLKSGRKFILKAVPCFPPLTPCNDSKDTTNQKQ